MRNGSPNARLENNQQNTEPTMQASERSIPMHAPMNQFPIEDGELLVGDIPLTRLASRVGQTPFYAYDRRLLTQRVEVLRTALPKTLKIHYAMKANPMPALVGHMARLVTGDGSDWRRPVWSAATGAPI